MRPAPGTYPQYWENYIHLAKENDVLEALENNWRGLKQCISQIPLDKEDYAYQEGKWTVKELVNHLLDTERVFTYRALRFARKDPKQPLPFEENDYVKNAPLGHRNLNDILLEFELLRKSTIAFFKGCTAESLLYIGKMASGDATPLALGYAIAGHAAHHLNILN